MKRILSISIALLLACASLSAQQLMVGAGKVEITPKESELQKETDTIRGHLYLRAIYITDGTSSAVLAGADAGAVHELDEAIAKASAATGCPEENFFVSGTHTHSGGTVGIDSGHPSHEEMADALVAAVKQAKAGLKPARVGFGKATVDLNVNRDNYNERQEWEQKPNWEGPADKDLTVLTFLGEDDVPIAMYLNYGMHPVNFFMSGVVTADYPGDACCFIEDYFDGRTVAVFGQGASGDVNPKLAYSALFREGPISGVLPQDGQLVRLGPDSDEKMTDEQLALYRQNIKRKDEYAHMLGTSIAFSALQVMLFATKYETAPAVGAARRTLSCPGRERVGGFGRENVVPEFKDADNVEIGMGLLSIGDIKIVTVGGEIYSEIGLRVKKESPSSKTLVTTVAFTPGLPFGSSGYIYSNNAANHLTFQVVGSRLKPGYAEGAIVDAALDMIRETK